MIAAPVGPVGLLCIRRTIQKGALNGFATGFGAAFADTFFSALAAFGVAAITNVITAYERPLQVFGGVFLLFVAWHTWHDKPRPAAHEDAEIAVRLRLHGALKAMVSSFVITLTNPATLFGTLAVIATLGGLQGRGEAATLVAGVFIGSSLWWLMLSGGTMLVRSRFSENRIVTINRVTAVALAVLAIAVMTIGIAHYLGVLPVGTGIPLLS